VQTKLTINKPGDEYERQADQVAEAVVHMPDAQPKPGLTATSPAPALNIQRLSPRPAEEEEAEEEPAKIDAYAKLLDTHSPQSATPLMQNQINGLRGSGQSLPDSVKSYFEPRFGQDFGSVRLHTDSRAAQLAQSLNARAFTVGRDLVFGAGQYAPQTLEGRKLIAHELTHVLQQSHDRSIIRRKISFEPPAYTRINPIDAILHNKPVGLTTPTFNGVQLPADPKSASDPKQAQKLYNQAGQTIIDAFIPKAMDYNSTAQECAFSDFEAKISANVIIPILPKDNKWTLTFPGPEIAGCSNKGNVPVVMSGKPDSDSILKLVESNEQEHVDDLKGLYNKYFEPFFKWLLALKGKGSDASKCQESLMTARGNKDGVTAVNFIKDWSDAIDKRHQGGRHVLHNTINLKNKCSNVEIESTK
jgi:hypothetical protein